MIDLGMNYYPAIPEQYDGGVYTPSTLTHVVGSKLVVVRGYNHSDASYVMNRCTFHITELGDLSISGGSNKIINNASSFAIYDISKN